MQKLATRKRDASLREKERRFQDLVTVFDTISTAIVITDRKGQIRFVNNPMRELVRHTKSGQLSEILHPDDQQRYLEFRNRIAAAPGQEAIEVRCLHPDLGIRWLAIKARHTPGTGSEKDPPALLLAMIDDITDQKNQTEHSRLSEQRYRTILDTISDEYWETDLDGRFVFWNRAFEDKARMPVEDIKQLRPADYTDAETVRYIQSTFRDVARTGKPILDEIEIYGLNEEKTGRIKRTVQNSVHLKRDEEGNPIGFFGLARDITVLKQTEQALRESEEKFKVMSDQSLLGISIMQDNRSLYRNDAMATIFGYTQEEMNACFNTKYLYDHVLHPDDRDFAQEQNLKKQQGILEGQVHNHQYRICTRQGDIKWVDQYSKTISYRGRPANLITMIDITDQKRAEAALLESQHRLMTHIESTPMGVIEFDNDFTITDWNPAAEAIFGFTREEAIGSNIFEFLVPDYDHENVKTVHRIDTPRSNKNINDNLTKDGRIITVQWFNTPIRDVHGNLVGMAAACQDITEQLQTQKLLIQSEKMMSIGGLAAGMAHEINNPLGAILQMAQNLERRLSPDLDKNLAVAEKHGIDMHRLHQYMTDRDIPHYLNAIMQSGKRAATIISDMLHFSRRSDTKKVPLDLNRLLERALDLARTDYDLKKKYDFRHIEIIKAFDPALPHVTCSETEIEQVFLNLFKNCAQAMEKRENDDPPRILLGTSQENGMARIEIADNGSGIEESIRSRVFEPFFTTKPVGEGTGLGLSVSYMIITGNHQGTMEVESEPGQGTRFIVRLPMK
ncbi:PAS domain S-box protein [bacterium]|nr:PAS domain S-box protein [bacterium]